MYGTYSENKGDDGSMRHAPRAHQPPIQCEEVAEELMWHAPRVNLALTYSRNKGDDGLLRCALRVYWCLSRKENKGCDGLSQCNPRAYQPFVQNYERDDKTTSIATRKKKKRKTEQNSDEGSGEKCRSITQN
eukprot:5933272-Ditylum_brightwellii.AAC.1